MNGEEERKKERRFDAISRIKLTIFYITVVVVVLENREEEARFTPMTMLIPATAEKSSSSSCWQI